MDTALYEISIINSPDNKVLVFSKGANTISDYIAEIAEILKKRCYRGEVIFDLVLSNGIDDRYYHINFNGTSFDYVTLSKEINVSSEISCYSKIYYREHIRLLKFSSLSPYQKNQFIKLLRR